MFLLISHKKWNILKRKMVSPNMKRVFVETTIFTKRWKELKLTDNDLQNLQNFILKNPNAGDVIPGTGGLTKLRWGLPSKGKSGGLRVLHIDFTRQEKVFLVNCYTKSRKDTLSDSEKAMYRELIHSIKEALQ